MDATVNGVTTSFARFATAQAVCRPHQHIAPVSCLFDPAAVGLACEGAAMVADGSLSTHLLQPARQASASAHRSDHSVAALPQALA